MRLRIAHAAIARSASFLAKGNADKSRKSSRRSFGQTILSGAKAMPVSKRTASALSLPLFLFHITDKRPPIVVHMDMLDADYLLTAVTQASKNFQLHRKRLH